MTSSVRRDKFVFAEELIATRVSPILVRASAAVQEQKGLARACDLIEEVDTVDSDGELTLFIRHAVFSATALRAQNDKNGQGKPSLFGQDGAVTSSGSGMLFRGFWRGFEALQFFAGLEADSLAWGNVDFFTGARVAADAGLARLDAEDPKAAQFNALAAAEGSF